MEENKHSIDISDYNKLWLETKFVSKQEYDEDMAKIRAELKIQSDLLSKNTNYLNTLHSVITKLAIPVTLIIVSFILTFALNRIFY